MNKQIDLQLTGGNNANSRRELDYYPTPPVATIALMDFLKLPRTTIWEPACGTGEMARVIESYGHTVKAQDIRDTGYGIGGLDFLRSNERAECIITNPPFALSEQFIRHALKLAPTVCMLLKSQYWHAAKRYQLFVQHPPAFVLPLTWRPDFLNGERGGAPTMEMAWTVWIQGNTDCKYIPLQKP